MQAVCTHVRMSVDSMKKYVICKRLLLFQTVVLLYGRCYQLSVAVRALQSCQGFLTVNWVSSTVPENGEARLHDKTVILRWRHPGWWFRPSKGFFFSALFLCATQAFHCTCICVEWQGNDWARHLGSPILPTDSLFISDLSSSIMDTRGLDEQSSFVSGCRLSAKTKKGLRNSLSALERPLSNKHQGTLLRMLGSWN